MQIYNNIYNYNKYNQRRFANLKKKWDWTRFFLSFQISTFSASFFPITRYQIWNWQKSVWQKAVQWVDFLKKLFLFKISKFKIQNKCKHYNIPHVFENLVHLQKNLEECPQFFRNIFGTFSGMWIFQLWLI